MSIKNFAFEYKEGCLNIGKTSGKPVFIRLPAFCACKMLAVFKRNREKTFDKSYHFR